jgi:hypothetical protein
VISRPPAHCAAIATHAKRHEAGSASEGKRYQELRTLAPQALRLDPVQARRSSPVATAAPPRRAGDRPEPAPQAQVDPCLETARPDEGAPGNAG